MSVTVSISLTEEQEAFARQLVRTGRFASLSAVLQHGMEMVRRDTELHQAEVAALRALLDERRRSRAADLEDDPPRSRTTLA